MSLIPIVVVLLAMSAMVVGVAIIIGNASDDDYGS